MPGINLELYTDDPTLIEICKLYWKLDPNGNWAVSTSQIAKSYNISSSKLVKIVTANANAYSENYDCQRCGRPCILKSRTDCTSGALQNWVCEPCKAELRQIEEIEQAKLHDLQKGIVKQTCDLKIRKAIDPATLSFEDAIYLLSLIRLAASEDFGVIYPLETRKDLLSPNFSFDIEIIRRLYESNLIYVHPDSNVDAFTFDGTSISQFSLIKVMWALPVSASSTDPEFFVRELEDLIKTEKKWPEEWHNEWMPLWKKVALQECLQYLKVTLEEHGLSFNPGKKTILTFNNLLEDYSVAQIYNFIWRAAKDAAAFWVRTKSSKLHAANTVIGSIQSAAERALAEGWEIKPYRRHFECQKSMLYMVLFDTALKIGDTGFNDVPKLGTYEQ